MDRVAKLLHQIMLTPFLQLPDDMFWMLIKADHVVTDFKQFMGVCYSSGNAHQLLYLPVSELSVLKMYGRMHISRPEEKKNHK